MNVMHIMYIFIIYGCNAWYGLKWENNGSVNLYNTNDIICIIQYISHGLSVCYCWDDKKYTALGTLNPQTQSQFLSRELRMAFALSAILSVAGFLRATIFQTPFPETMAVTIALSMIVFTSICLGAILPLLLQKIGVDPAHSSTTIQVVMDILGVVLTVLISAVVLDSGWGQGLIKAFGAVGL